MFIPTMSWKHSSTHWLMCDKSDLANTLKIFNTITFTIEVCQTLQLCNAAFQGYQLVDTELCGNAILKLGHIWVNKYGGSYFYFVYRCFFKK